MKRKSYFGYKLLVVIALGIAIANAAARDHEGPLDFYDDPQPDSNRAPVSNRDTSLPFPLYDRTGNPTERIPSSIDVNDPPNLKRSVEYDPEDKRYYFNEKLSDRYLDAPTYMTQDEYLKYQSEKDEQSYWKRRQDALTLFNKKPTLPTMYKEGLFDRIFGGSTISVRPQGNVDVTFGGNWQNIKNPALPARAQKYGIFDFDMQMNVNLLATVGDKLKLNISNNTKATFDYQNMQRLEYTGKEDEIIKKIEAGNISFPLKSNLINGVQSLFGLKTQLQFGKLWVTGVVSQQKSKRQSLTIQGGQQTQQFSLKADDYEENRHFLLSQYFFNNYNNSLKNYPVINSLVTINKLEVWVTNRTGATEGIRNIVGFLDLGEDKPFLPSLSGPVKPVPYGLPDNTSNQLYLRLTQNPATRVDVTATSAIQGVLASGDSTLGRDFIRVSARKLNTTEYSFNPQLGYISLNTQLNPDDVVAVSFRYTYNGKVYQVGEFSEDLPPSSGTTVPGGTTSPGDQKILFMKLIKGTASNPRLPTWGLMMKNIYALGGLGVAKEDFRLNVLYQDPGGGEKRYIPEGPSAGIPLLTLLNLDRLNIQNDPAPDGIFDFVEGITINTQQGKIIFPVLQPFGEDLAPALGNNLQLGKKYQYDILYDSTKTVARQFQQNNRYVIKGAYKSASSSEIFLGGFNIPQGSVAVSAGGQKLVENVDYQIDYGLGRLKILNSGILNSGIPINVQYEDNATFGFQQQNFTGLRLDYYVNDKLALGGTYMKLAERPFTQKTSFGEDPIKNTVLGLDVNYQSEAMGVTRLLDKLPIYATTAPSIITAQGEVAGLLPSHAKQINTLDPEGSVYIDDFEGTRSSYDLKFPPINWTLASTPFGAMDKNGQLLFPEAKLSDNVEYGRNRARLAWYTIENTLIDGSTGVPEWVKKDPNQHYIRLIQQQEVFPQKTTTTLQSLLTTLDLGYYPKERGPYNLDYENINADGTFTNPKARWGGIMRAIDNTDFEQSNVETIEFWMMDPFINNPTAAGGSFYINLGNVSEDVLKDSRKFFENGIPYPKDNTKLDQGKWGYTPKFQQQITRAFDNDPAARAVQDVGYDGLDNEEERAFFANSLKEIVKKVSPATFSDIQNDPASDDYRFYRGTEYDNAGTGILARYKHFNNPQGNSPASDGNAAFSSAGTNVPESEDINRDNTLNDAEDYYQYRIDLTPNMQVGNNYIINKQVSNVKLPNGNIEPETWYQFKVPIREYTQKVGNIADFRSIRFIRMFLNGFQDSVVLRFARIELGRNNWRRYAFSLQDPGENIPEEDQKNVDFAVTSVSYEENSDRQPIPYVLPPGVNRQQTPVANGQNVQLNEQALSLQVCGLPDGDSRAAFKEVSVDMRQFKKLRMFMHAESQVGRQQLKNGDVVSIIRLGSDFTNNYYEYRVPLQVTAPGTSNDAAIWPEANRVDLLLEDLVSAKTERNVKGAASYIPYYKTDSKGNTIVVVGNPNIGDAKTILLGIHNPKKTNATPNDDGMTKCAEVWYNELRMVGLDETPGYAASGKVTLQMADLGNVSLAGSMHTQGYGNIDQKLNQRYRDNFYQYNASTNLNLGKLMPRKWGVQLPAFVGYSQTVSNPQYDPYDLDVKYSDKLDAATSAAQRDSMRKLAQDFTSITSVNFSNVRVTGNPEKVNAKTMPWSVKNFDLSYAYNKQFKRNPTIEGDELTTNRLGLGYTYNIKTKAIEPFKKLVKSKSKWLALVKEFNFKLLPANFTFRTDLNRTFNETKVRVISDGPIDIEPTYYKNFTWTRTYNLRWELTRSLSFDYNATNNSRVDEPYGRIDNAAKRDTLWDRVKTFGRNTYFTQAFNASYNLPLQKVPLLDWTSLQLTYGSTYSWTAASRLAESQGNIIGNTQSKQARSELNFTQLYNKQRWLKSVNLPKTNKGATQDKKTVANKSLVQQDGSGDNQPPAKNKIKDLRKNKKADVPNSNTATQNSEANKPDTTKDTKPKYYDIATNTSKFNDKQLDSVKKSQDKQEADRLAAEKLKKKKARIAARKAKRSSVADVSNAERVVGRLLTMVKRTTVTLSENAGSTLPGYMDSTQALGMNMSSMQPGWGYAYGFQPDRAWLEAKANAGLLSRDSLFNAQFQQNYQQNLNITTTVEPFKDFRIDFSLNKTFSKSHSELYKDTTLTGRGEFTHNNPYESGSFSISYIALKTMFKSSDATSGTFAAFAEARKAISERLGARNPYTNNVADPNDPNYQKGYTAYSQDVLVPAFVAAYSGKSPKSVGLVESNNQGIRSNPFKNYLPMPNWRIAYNGLTKIPFFNDFLNNLVINHAYTGTLSMNSFVSTLFYQDIYSFGFPSFIDSNSGNYVPFYQVPNVTISEQLNPLIGFDASFKNNLSARFEYRKTRTASLSMVDYQVSETKSTEYVIGLGYRIKGLTLPFELFGVRRLKNDINIKMDVGLRDDISSNNYLAQVISVTTRGQKVITISPSIDYIVSDKLTLRFFYDRRQSIPYVTSSFPITTTRGGVTLRFIFAQ